MGAFDEILSFSSKEKLNDYRQSLVSYKRGTLTSGSFNESLSILYADGEQSSLLNEQFKEPKKIFLRAGSGNQHPGVVFDSNGTDRALSNIASGGSLKLLEEFSGMLKFKSSEDKENWQSSERLTKKRCLSRNIEELIKRTDINYRTHGDRLHYFVIGLVTLKSGNLVDRYPLFLFSCTDVNKNTLEIEVEATGFVNFWLDRNLLENNLVKAMGTYEVSLDESFGGLVNTLTAKLSSLQSSEFEEITIDPRYSAVSIVSGFEPEYIDPVWEKLR